MIITVVFRFAFNWVTLKVKEAEQMDYIQDFNIKTAAAKYRVHTYIRWADTPGFCLYA